MNNLLGSRTKGDSAVLLADFDALLRGKPEALALNYRTDDAILWFGRASALISKWDHFKVIAFDSNLNTLLTGRAHSEHQLMLLMLEIQKARNALLLDTETPLTTSIQAGNVFDYYTQVRSKIEAANQDLFFVDPYLDNDFVSKYLAGVRSEVAVRLLTMDNKLATLVPAVKLLKEQQKQSIEIRISKLHDRFLFVDGKECFQSGSSFKDGAAKAPTVFSQIIDFSRTLRETPK